MKVVYIFRDAKNGGYSIEEIFKGVISHLPASVDAKIFYFKKEFSLLKNICLLLKFDADIYHITGDIYFLSLFLPRKKVVLTLHDIGHYKTLKSWRKKIYGLLWIRLPFSRAAEITCVSTYTFEDLVRFFPSLRRDTHIIPNPAPPLFKESTSQFNSNIPRILQVGTGQHKNLPVLFSAVKDIRCKLVIIGPLTSHHIELLERYKIDYDNYINLTQLEVYMQYVHCDIVSFVTLHEGFGMPVLEAQATGRPLVTSKVCSLPEVTNNSTAMIENPSDTTSLRNTLVRIIEDEPYRSRLVIAGFKNVARFNIKKIVNMYMIVYKLIER